MLVEPGKKAKSIKFTRGRRVGRPGRTAPDEEGAGAAIEDENGKSATSRGRSSRSSNSSSAPPTRRPATTSCASAATARRRRCTRRRSRRQQRDRRSLLQEGPEGRRSRDAAAAGGGPKPSPGGKEATRIDERVTKGRVVIDKYFGISEFTKLDEAAQPAYNAAVARMGALVRGGMDPEKAANQALLEQKDGRLNPDGTPKAAAAPAPGAGGCAPRQRRLHGPDALEA
jgi:hypothetical protein